MKVHFKHIFVPQQADYCECERSFSALRKLKDYRNTMSSLRLNGLALLYIHQDIELDVEKVIDLFAKDRRKIELEF